jgi:hypothetical protein
MTMIHLELPRELRNHSIKIDYVFIPLILAFKSYNVLLVVSEEGEGKTNVTDHEDLFQRASSQASTFHRLSSPFHQKKLHTGHGRYYSMKRWTFKRDSERPLRGPVPRQSSTATELTSQQQQGTSFQQLKRDFIMPPTHPSHPAIGPLAHANNICHR